MRIEFKKLNLIKLLFSIFLAAVLSIIFVCAYGCSNIPSWQITAATKPEYDYKTLLDMEQEVQFTNRKQDDGYDVFAEFSNYYKNTYVKQSANRFYILNPADGDIGWVPHYRLKTFTIYNSDARNDEKSYSFLTEQLYLYIKENGETASDDNFSGNVGGFDWNLDLTIILSNISSGVKGDYIFAFGDNYSGIANTYFNIYVGESCIATCYYSINESSSFNFSTEWFADYFSKNLNYGV